VTQMFDSKIIFIRNPTGTLKQNHCDSKNMKSGCVKHWWRWPDKHAELLNMIEGGLSPVIRRGRLELFGYFFFQEKK
jgi:hypothetical protein